MISEQANVIYNKKKKESQFSSFLNQGMEVTDYKWYTENSEEVEYSIIAQGRTPRCHECIYLKYMNFII